MLVLDWEPTMGWPRALLKAQDIENPSSSWASCALGLAVEVQVRVGSAL